jgi:hypothetical protein
VLFTAVTADGVNKVFLWDGSAVRRVIALGDAGSNGFTLNEVSNIAGSGSGFLMMLAFGSYATRELRYFDGVTMTVLQIDGQHATRWHRHQQFLGKRMYLGGEWRCPLPGSNPGWRQRSVCPPRKKRRYCCAFARPTSRRRMDDHAALGQFLDEWRSLLHRGRVLQRSRSARHLTKPPHNKPPPPPRTIRTYATLRMMQSIFSSASRRHNFRGRPHSRSPRR